MNMLIVILALAVVIGLGIWILPPAAVSTTAAGDQSALVTLEEEVENLESPGDLAELEELLLLEQ
ncbi:MAG: hypothetical protein HY369_04340 [Candidatus Aenigmarchaeota archaeon]|nr:hypothetical protein [Candidatus Aenigmarchaeota archaeon]